MDIQAVKNALELLEKLQSVVGGGTACFMPLEADGRKVIVRSRDAGVLYGTFMGAEGSTVSLVNARQLWSWYAAKGHTLLDVATYGVDGSKCKFSPSSAPVVVFNACAVIDVTGPAAASIEAV